LTEASCWGTGLRPARWCSSDHGRRARGALAQSLGAIAATGVHGHEQHLASVGLRAGAEVPALRAGTPNPTIAQRPMLRQQSPRSYPPARHAARFLAGALGSAETHRPRASRRCSGSLFGVSSATTGCRGRCAGKGRGGVGRLRCAGAQSAPGPALSRHKIGIPAPATRDLGRFPDVVLLDLLLCSI
jgi:hypothetical protein